MSLPESIALHTCAVVGMVACTLMAEGHVRVGAAVLIASLLALCVGLGMLGARLFVSSPPGGPRR